MTPDEREQAERLAGEARRLLNEPLLVEALDGIMADAFAEFKIIPITAANLDAVIALQARANAAQDLFQRLNARIIASGAHDGGIDVEKRPSA